MNSEEAIRQEARMLALETLWAHTYNVINRIVGADETVIASIETDAREKLRTTFVRDVSPAMSDHLSGEIEMQIDRLLLIAREMREAGTGTAESR